MRSGAKFLFRVNINWNKELKYKKAFVLPLEFRNH